MKTKNKPEVVVVTGASAGIGRAVVRAFASQKAHIGLLARGQDGLEAACKEVESAGGRALAFPTDVADFNRVESAAAAIEESFGPIDIWVNNAMLTVLSPFKEITPEEYKRVTDVTYLGCVYGTMVALRRMLPRNHGVIVQVGSALAYRSIPLQSAYCGAKHAIKGFTDSIRSELIHDKSNVHVTMVQLSAHNTPQFSWAKTRMQNHPQPVPPIFQPEVAAEAIVWAARHRRREVTVGFPAFKAIQGNKFLPGFADRYLSQKGYSGQQTDQAVNPNRPDNLWQALPGDYGAHGVFDRQARTRSWYFWVHIHRGWILFAVTTIVAAVITAFIV